MGFFRRSKNAAKSAKNSASRHATATSIAESAPMDAPLANEALVEPNVVAGFHALERNLDDGLHDEEARKDDSDIFVCEIPASVIAEPSGRSPSTRPAPSKSQPPRRVDPSVTLYVYGWHNVEPGPLSWAFPSLRAALDAVRTMRNAVQWCIVSGKGWTSVDDARAEGAVLVEQLG